MYRKTKKLFAVSLVVTMLLTMTLFSGMASAAATSNRLEGGDRYATALNIVKAGWTSSEYAVLATGEGYADALAAAPLAKAYNAPILLVDPTTDNAALKAELTALGVTKVFVVGGEGVVSKAFADSLTGVTRLAGANRVETAVKVAEQLVAKVGTISEIAVANEDSYADALSIAPIAANKNMPILLTSKDSLSAEVSAFLAGKTITKSYVVGETGVVSDAVKAVLPGAVRLGGANRYATNLAVLSNFAPSYANVFVATGENYPDALAGSAYAAKLNAPVVLVDGTVDSATAAYVAGKATPATKVVALGGAAVVSDEAVAGLVAAINAATFQVTEIKAINARQLMVKFNKPVDKASAQDTAKYHIGSGYPGSATLQSDEMSVLLTMGANLATTATLYVVDPVALKADTTVKTAIFTYVETYSDTAAPSVASVTYPVYNQAKITFSEPLAELPAPVISGTDVDGNAISSLTAVTPWTTGGSSVTYSLENVKENTPVTVVFVGAKDYAGNLITPNPTTVTFTKVKSDTTAPSVVAVTPLSDVRLSVTFSEALASAPSVTVDTSKAVASWESTDNVTWTGTFASTTGIANVAVAKDYADPSGNKGAAYSKLYEFKADTTAPVLLNTTVEVISSKPYLVFHYNEDVTAASAVISGTRVKDNISYPAGGGSIAAAAYVNGTVTDTKAVMVDMSLWTDGVYNLTVAAGLAVDKASTPNPSASATVSVTKGTIVTDSSAPHVDSFTMSANNDYATVVFSEDMDVTSAWNLANYKVNGQNIFTNAIFDQNAYTVKLTVAPGTITYTGAYLVQISGVKDVAGNVMTAYSVPTTFDETVKPYVASAKLTSSSTLTVTFSEEVNVDANAFEVYVNGEKVASTTNSAVTNNKTVNVTFTAIDSLSKTVQVKLVDTDTVDQNGNFAVTGTLVTAGF